MSSRNEGTQRVGPLMRVPHVLKNLGADSVEVLGSVGLSEDALDDPDASINYLDVGRLLRACVEHTGCRHFGLLVGRLADLDSFGPVGRLMRSASDVRTALNDLICSEQHSARGAVTYLLPSRDAAVLGYAVYQPHVPALDQIADLFVAACCNALRELADVRPDEIMLAHAAPADVTPYRRLLPSQVRFDADQTGLVLPMKLLAHSNPAADPVMHAAMKRGVGQFCRADEPDVTTQLQQLLRPQIVLHRPRVEEAAAQLSIHPRTLNRRLHEEGTSFREVLNEVRFETASQLLTDTQLGVTRIALTLGYADPSVFTHAFRRWAGVPPREWRGTHIDRSGPAAHGGIHAIG
jgi:AraC-like DNA-binding protein